MKIYQILSLAAVIAVHSTFGIAIGQEIDETARAQIEAIQQKKSQRTEAEGKLESRLIYLAREAKGLPAVEAAPDMKSRVQLDESGRVVVEIAAVPSADLVGEITRLGGVISYQSTRWKVIRVAVLPAALLELAERADVTRIKKSVEKSSHTGPINNAADIAQKAQQTRAGFGVDGTGVKIGVISDSVHHLEESLAAGELPSTYTVLPGRSGTGDSSNEGEGTAMSEIVHDIAPGADIFFAEAGPGKQGFADSILLLRDAGCQIIVDDISYPNEWQFQDDEIGQAINEVVDGGVVYLSSSGNEGSLKRGNSTTWEGDFLDGGTNSRLPDGRVHDFGGQVFNRLTEDKSDAVFQWSDEYNSSANDYDLYILNAAGTRVVASSTNEQTGTQEPIEMVDRVRKGERIVIWKANEAAPRYLRLSCTGSPLELQTAGQTIGHAGTPKCICVASSDASIPVPGSFSAASVVNDSSSDGPHQMFFNEDGTPITPGNFLAGGGLLVQTPAITGGDGGATSLADFNPFYGTSAAAPACAAIGALILQRNPALDGPGLRAILEGSCIDIEDPGFDVNSGNGILMASIALRNALAGPEITLEQPLDTTLDDGGSRHFGVIPVNTTSPMVFTIRNLGSAPLTVSNVSVFGDDAADFDVQLGGPLDPFSGDLEVTVTFQPTVIGAKKTTLKIESDDVDEPSIEIALQGISRDSNSVAVDDIVKATNGVTYFAPLANDDDSGGMLSIVSVSDPSVQIMGRNLLIPAGFTGYFAYVVTDGGSSYLGAVEVIAGSEISNPIRWSGLLYGDVSGVIEGIAYLNRRGNIYSGYVRIGTARQALRFRFDENDEFAREFRLGSLTAVLEEDGRVTLDLDGENDLYSGELRQAVSNPDPQRLNVALKPADLMLNGAGYLQAIVRRFGTTLVRGRGPDGRRFAAGTWVGDNESIAFYSLVPRTNSRATVAGLLNQADLSATDVTGELDWNLPEQRRGLYSDGLMTVLAATGSKYVRDDELIADGTGILNLTGGDLASNSMEAVNLFNGRPELPTPFIRFWVPVRSTGIFRVRVLDPDRGRVVPGDGVYLQKSQSAWGFFPGSTEGGRISLLADPVP
ncbi:MAG: choice-of-anchor D domain-containing protein [Verrucomicrobiae bacterium]|nr:choice-of-anchor D domain-containing protein [Verrucomicrobiae bacterium]